MLPVHAYRILFMHDVGGRERTWFALISSIDSADMREINFLTYLIFLIFAELRQPQVKFRDDSHHRMCFHVC